MSGVALTVMPPGSWFCRQYRPAWLWRAWSARSLEEPEQVGVDLILVGGRNAVGAPG